MPTSDFRVEATRGPLTESLHRVSVAVVDAEGRLLASAGNPELVTWWRSAAKPFQAMPLVLDGVAERFGLEDGDLALACASHSSEPIHLETVDRFMARTGVSESELACGPHPPISPEVAEAVARSGTVMTPRWSNCSGKHTGMLALARHHGWPVEGYQSAGHPVQERVLDEVSTWTGVAREEIRQAPDGCTAVCFALPLRNMALAYARLGVSGDPAPARIRGAMMAHPLLVAGRGRLCSALMTAWAGRIVAKVGADGIYCAALPGLALGLALKVEDGDGVASRVALLEVLRQVVDRWASASGYSLAELTPFARPPITNTRGTITGAMGPAGALRFADG
jgi:L-asparaginase II